MKILHVIDTTGPGGAETLFVELCKAFNLGANSSIALLRGPGWVAEQMERYGIIHYIRDCKGSFNFGFLFYLISLIRAQNVDVIQSHLLGSNVYCALAGLLTQTPVISTFHGSVDIDDAERFVKIKFLIVKSGSTIVAVSEALRDVLISWDPSLKDRVEIVKNGIDCARFGGDRGADLRREFALPSDAFVVGALGNIRPAKDYPTAIRSLAEVVKQDPTLYLIIAGDTNHVLYQELVSLVNELNVSANIRFAGFRSSPEQFLAGLDLYMLSSRTEGHPFSVIQAMASGLPVLATRCGVETMLSDGVDAVLVESENPHRLAEKLLELKRSLVTREKLGEAARNKALTNYDFGVTAARYAELYAQAVKKIV